MARGWDSASRATSCSATEASSRCAIGRRADWKRKWFYLEAEPGSGLCVDLCGPCRLFDEAHHLLHQLLRACTRHAGDAEGRAPSIAGGARYPRRRLSASFGGSRSILFSTSQRGFVARSLLNFLSSPTIARASFTGSASGSGGAISTRCSSTRVRCRCLQELDAEPRAFRRAFDEPRNVRHHEAAMLADGHDTEIRDAAW